MIVKVFDLGNKTGVSVWRDGNLIESYRMRKVGALGKWSHKGEVFPSQWRAFFDAVHGCDRVICEEGCGRFATAIKSQADYRGYLRAVCDYQNAYRTYETVFVVINVSEWRRVIKEAYGISWPATTERKKALSVKLVKEHFGLSVTDDEADAVLIGEAAKRMGMF